MSQATPTSMLGESFVGQAQRMLHKSFKMRLQAIREGSKNGLRVIKPIKTITAPTTRPTGSLANLSPCDVYDYPKRIEIQRDK